METLELEPGKKRKEKWNPRCEVKKFRGRQSDVTGGRRDAKLRPVALSFPKWLFLKEGNLLKQLEVSSFENWYNQGWYRGMKKSLT